MAARVRVRVRVSEAAEQEELQVQIAPDLPSPRLSSAHGRQGNADNPRDCAAVAATLEAEPAWPAEWRGEGGDANPPSVLSGEAEEDSDSAAKGQGRSKRGTHEDRVREKSEIAAETGDARREREEEEEEGANPPSVHSVEAEEDSDSAAKGQVRSKREADEDRVREESEIAAETGDARREREEEEEEGVDENEELEDQVTEEGKEALSRLISLPTRTVFSRLGHGENENAEKDEDGKAEARAEAKQKRASERMEEGEEELEADVKEETGQGNSGSIEYEAAVENLESIGTYEAEMVGSVSVEDEIAEEKSDLGESEATKHGEATEKGNARKQREGEKEKEGDGVEHREEEEDEEEEDVCRICRTSGENGSPLYHPCACSGSIKYVHQECLLQWLNHSNARHCEVCKHSFSFSPVYAENAPIRLSYQEFVLGLAIKGGRGMHFFLRLVFVMSIWLIFIPFTTFWIWRLTFIRSISEAQHMFIQRLIPTLFFTDCLHGFLLSAGIVFIFLGATSLREYFRHLRELGGLDVDREEDGQARGGRRQLIGDRVEGGGGGNREGGGLGQGIAAGAGQLIRRNAENVAARLEMQAARLEAHVEQMFDGADDVDGAEDVPFDELVGMQGPVFHLLENAITVLASNAIFLGLVAFFPFTLGRIVLSLASRLMVMGPFNVIFRPSVKNFLSSNILDIGQNINTTINLVNTPENSMVGSSTFADMLLNASMQAPSIVQVAETVMDAKTFKFSDATTVAAGYTVIIIAVGFHLSLRALIKYIRGEQLTVNRLHGVASLAEAAPTVARQVISALKYMMTMLKVAFLLLVELGVFPLLCGWWLDICTLSMFGGTVSNRVAFFWASPLTSSLVHWLVGIVYMLHISIFVSLLREVLRPGVLYFLRDPADPNYNPFHDLVEDPIHKHARRVLLSVVVYGSLIVMLIFLPVKLALSVAPSLFPLDIRISDPFTEIPADMLLFHICIPFAIEHFRPKATIKTVLLYWFTWVGWALGLSDFLLPPVEEANDQGGGEVAVHGFDEVQPAVPVENAEELEIDHQNDAEEYMFAFRIVLLLIGAWITLLFFNSTIMLLPVSLGRGIFSSISSIPISYGVKCNDLYAFNIGCYVIWATIAAIGYAVDYLKTHNARILLMQIVKWTGIVTKSSMLLSLWIVVIPVLIGLLFELLVVIPLRVPVDESPVFLLYQDWALGLVFLKIWTRLVMFGQIAPLVDDSWRTKFERVKADGFTRLRGVWIMREIVLPILVTLLTALCAPYVFARGLFPVLGYSLIVNSAVYRFAWSGCLLLGLIWYGIKSLQQWLSELHNAIRDDRYLIGKRLHNFGEKKVEDGSTQPTTSLLPDESSEPNISDASALIDSDAIVAIDESLVEHADLDGGQSFEDGIEEFTEGQHLMGLRRRHSPAGYSIRSE